MKAIRVHEFGGPEVMRLEEMPDLKAGPGQVVVRTKAVGVNPVDTYIRSGIYGAERPLPCTPGMDAAGIVEYVGEGVNSFVVGARVYIAGTAAPISGTYAEQVLCPHTQVHRLPANVSFEEGAAIGVPAAIAYRSLFQKARAVPAETLLVHGASGGVGTSATQLARAAGLVVIGTAGTDKGIELVLKQGAHHALNHRTEGYPDRILELTDGRGVDVILEMLSNVNLGKDLKLLAHGGRVVVIGSRGTVEIDPRDAMSRDASIIGVSLLNVTSNREYASIHAALVASLENGTLRPVIGSQLPLADAPRSHEAVLESGSYGKIILMP
jgi:NADPH:quinone reductase